MDALELPPLPHGYRWQVEPGDHTGDWLVTIEHRVGWRWWRGGWRHWWTREARLISNGGQVDLVDGIRITAEWMADALAREREKLQQDQYLRQTLDAELRKQKR